MALRDHAAKFERLAADAEGLEEATTEAIVATPEAEALMRKEGKILRIDVDPQGGLRLATVPAGLHMLDGEWHHGEGA